MEPSSKRVIQNRFRYIRRRKENEQSHCIPTDVNQEYVPISFPCTSSPNANQRQAMSPALAKSWDPHGGRVHSHTIQNNRLQSIPSRPMSQFAASTEGYLGDIRDEAYAGERYNYPDLHSAELSWLRYELKQCQDSLKKEIRRTHQYKEDYTRLLHRLCEILENFNRHHSTRLKHCHNKNEIKELQVFAQILRADLQMVLVHHNAEDDQERETSVPYDESSGSGNRHASSQLAKNCNYKNLSETNNVETEFNKTGMVALKTKPEDEVSISISPPRIKKLEEPSQTVYSQIDDDLDVSDTHRSASTVSATPMGHFSSQSHFNKNKDILPQVQSRPAFVPALFTAKAGRGSWMAGEKEPVDYPQGQ